ncbi:hypothetical protein KUTeg_002956 [Tegillarca granosa]|uniref:Uncharacterized protein n=1 Tax=Tegillarca granosa TaxID=220873 RepID=A0ABQ9FQ63_TEGGR|nr:hypothetical protein KUTeg_002956 [Tegillarca granosa]
MIVVVVACCKNIANMESLMKTHFKIAHLLQIMFLFLYIGMHVVQSARTKLSFRIIMPNLKHYERPINEAKSSISRYTYGLPGYPDISILRVDTNSPEEIMNMFCDKILPNQVNTLLHLDLKSDRTSRISSNYIMNVAEQLGYPLFSWDPDYAGALEHERNRRILQMAPTIYHQSEAIVSVLSHYNWTHFVIVTTTGFVEDVIKKNNEVVGYLKKPSAKTTKDMLEVAESLGLTDSNYIWILTSTSIGLITMSTRLPLGLLGVTFRGEHRDELEMIKYAVKDSIKVGSYLPQRKGFRGEVNSILQMNDINWPGNAPFPPKGRPERRHFSIGTLEEEPYVMYRPRDESTGKCTIPAVPCRLNGTVTRCCTGLSIDLLRLLSDEMAFDYDLFEVPDKSFGVENPITGQWNGLIRLLQDKKADMVVGSLQITPKRSEQVEFSVPFLGTGLAIVVSFRKGAISATAVLEPYDYPAWCLILVFSVHSIGASIFIFEWLSPRGLDQGKTPLREHQFSLFRSFWLIWAMLFGASVSTDNPRGVSSKFLANIWALFALVFLASYTANLAAFMITKEVYYKLSGITDWRLVNPLSHKPPFRFATVPNGSTQENLMTNNPAMFEYMKSYHQPNVRTAIQELKKQKIQAFIYDASPLYYQVGIDQDCQLKIVGNWYARTGELERLRKFWLAGACHSKRKSGQSSHDLGILNFTSAFILLASGIVLGGLLLIVEHLYFRFGRKCLRKYDKCGCCSLVSLSMGKSLTFKQTIMEAIDYRKKHRCKDPLCENQLWKVKHELDLALLKIDKLNKERNLNRSKSVIEEKEEEARELNRPSSDKIKLSSANGGIINDDSVQKEERGLRKRNGSRDIVNEIGSMRRSPSYTQAVSASEDSLQSQISAKDVVKSGTPIKVRYSDGRYYSGVRSHEYEDV